MGLALRVIRIRDYIAARDYIERTEMKDLEMSPMVQRVLETQAKVQLGLGDEPEPEGFGQ